MFSIKGPYGIWAKGWWLIVIALLCGCGYQAVRKSVLPGDVNTVAVKVLTNRSIETGAEAIIANALADEINRHRPGTLIRVGDADAILAGAIKSIDHETVSRAGTLTALQERVTVKVELSLKGRSGKTLWGMTRFVAQEDYAVVDGNKTATQDNRRRAISKAALRLAEDVYRGLTDDF